MKIITGLMILSGHLVSLSELSFRDNDEYLFSWHFWFKSSADLEEMGNIDGNYVILDKKT